jgi:hypothetical protein
MTNLELICIFVIVFALIYLNHATEVMFKLKKENEILREKNLRLEKNIAEIMKQKFNL